MTLKKLFSHKEHHHSANGDNGSNSLKAYSRRHDASKASSSSLTRSISRLSHKDRDRQYSGQTKPRSSNYSSEKALVPNSTTVGPSRQLQSTSSNTTVEDRSAGLSTSTASEKFEVPDENSGQYVTSDIHNVVNSLRHSMAADLDEEDKDGSDSFHSVENVDEGHEEGDKADELYAELVTVGQRLQNVNAAHPVEMKEKIKDINIQLQTAVEKGNDLQSRTKAVVEKSKQLISTLTEQNKALSESNEAITNEIERIKKDNEAAIAELQRQHETKITDLSSKHETEIRSINGNLQSQIESGASAYQDLKTEHQRLLDENLALKAAEESLKTEVEQIRQAHDSVLRETQSSRETSLEELHTQHSTLLASHQQLKEQYDRQLSDLNDLREKHEQQSTALTDVSNQYREQLAVCESLQSKHIAQTKEFEELKAKYESTASENERLKAELEQQTDTQKKLTQIIQQNDNEKIADTAESGLQEKVQSIMMMLSAAQADKILLEQKLDSEQKAHQQELEAMQARRKDERRQQQEEFEKEKQTISQDYANREEKMLGNLRQENTNLSELVECLQAKIKELSVQNRNSMMSLARNNSTRSMNSKEQDRQEELMKMHTRAQFSLIEYLEGEDDVISAMAKFKKQLEAEMKELESTDVRRDGHIGPISAASASESMR